MSPRNRGGHPGRAAAPAAGDVSLRPILGASARMQRLLRLVSRVAPTDSTVLVLGESGTGKELVARSLHVLSRRAQAPFVAVNVGAIPEALMESELFGHARGSFTGATAERMGLVEEADHGTLFLDEIGDMPLPTQVKLLRMLENGEVRRVGENTPRMVDVRVVAATHRDLQSLVADGRFRADLYFRLNVVQLDLPPLRERREDIGLLASFFLDRAAQKQRRGRLEFAPEAMALLQRYDYPGNVRELENAIEHAVALTEGGEIGPHDLPAAIRTPRMLPLSGVPGAPSHAFGGPQQAPPEPARNAEADTRPLDVVLREHVLAALTRHRGNATAAAKQLGISRTTMWRMLKRWGVSRSAIKGS
ncbi:MAG: sigma-54-dependent Fis family transcriptional regulator [Candidatus Eisenbacteria bacterium]|nr:sigma-54-dependent Fis family transcriptional regulator [Candidatus Eisenbacteria bacterium]